MTENGVPTPPLVGETLTGICTEPRIWTGWIVHRKGKFPAEGNA